MENIFDELERGWDAFTSHVAHRPYHDPHNPATPATEAPMSLATLEADAEEVLSHFTGFVREKIPTAVADAKKVEAWLQLPGTQSVLDALTGNSHLPELALEELAAMIGMVGKLYAPPPSDPPAAAPADPAMGQPEAAAA